MEKLQALPIEKKYEFINQLEDLVSPEGKISLGELISLYSKFLRKELKHE